MVRLERIHLSLLREVDRQGSLTAAAKTLGLTQSALSHTVKRLEQQFGTAVWQREGRGLRLTAYAMVVFPMTRLPLLRLMPGA